MEKLAKVKLWVSRNTAHFYGRKILDVSTNEIDCYSSFTEGEEEGRSTANQLFNKWPNIIWPCTHILIAFKVAFFAKLYFNRQKGGGREGSPPLMVRTFPPCSAVCTQHFYYHLCTPTLIKIKQCLSHSPSVCVCEVIQGQRGRTWGSYESVPWI